LCGPLASRRRVGPWRRPGAPGIDAAVDRVLDLGGWVDIEPYDSELGRIARVADPAGASFALIDPTARIPPAELAAGSARVDDPYDD
jgi:hypothetical protein